MDEDEEVRMGFVLITVIYANKVIDLGCSPSALAAILKQVGQIAEGPMIPGSFLGDLPDIVRAPIGTLSNLNNF